VKPGQVHPRLRAVWQDLPAHTTYHNSSTGDACSQEDTDHQEPGQPDVSSTLAIAWSILPHCAAVSCQHSTAWGKASCSACTKTL
jgi:hypothetical protein